MSRTFKALSLLILAGLLSLAASGCGTSPAGQEASAAGDSAPGSDSAAAAAAPEEHRPEPQHLVVALGHGLDYLGVDPFGPGRENTVLSTAIYEPLALEGDAGYEPALAESWDVSPDGRTWTFQLRRGVTFHDGSAFDAAAVEYAFSRYMQDPVAGRRLGIAAVAAPDPHTVTFTLKEPSALFLGVVGSFSAVIPAPASYGPDGRLVQPIGTGPFKVLSHSRQQVELAAHADHWRGRPDLDTVTVRYLPDPATMVLALEAGEVDLIGADGYGVSRSEVHRLQADPGFRTLVYDDGAAIEWVGFNLYRGPLSDVRLRQAINHAIEREVIVTHLLEGFGSPAVGPLGHADAPWANPRISDYAHDPERARTLLAEAGWQDSDGDGVVERDGEKLELVMLFEGTREWKLYAEAIQQDLARVGIGLRLEMRDGDVIRDLQRKGEFDLVGLGGIGKNPVEPHYYLFYYYSSGGRGTVIRGDRELDQVIGRIAVTLDRTEREQLYHQAQDLIWAQVPGAYLVNPARVTVMQADVQGWQFAGTMDPLRRLWQVHRQ